MKNNLVKITLGLLTLASMIFILANAKLSPRRILALTTAYDGGFIAGLLSPFCAPKVVSTVIPISRISVVGDQFIFDGQSSLTNVSQACGSLPDENAKLALREIEDKLGVRHSAEPGSSLEGCQQMKMENGDWLISGGYQGILMRQDFDSVWFYRSRPHALTLAGHMAQPRANHSAILIAPDRVAFCAGDRDDVEEFSLASGRGSIICPLAFPRLNHSTVQVDQDHILLVEGSSADDPYHDNDSTNSTRTVELINLKARSARIIGKLNRPDWRPLCVLCRNKRILVIHGFKIDTSGKLGGEAELLDLTPFL